MSPIRFSTSACALLAGLLLSGCASPPTQIAEHLPPPPMLDMGPQLTLETAPRGHYWISETMDGAGHVHLIVARSDTKTVEHVSIGENGVISRETIRTGVEPRSVDIAFDRAGRLHALIDNAHFMRNEEGKWVGPLRTPLTEAHIDLARNTTPKFADHPLWRIYPRFIKGTPDLTWGFGLAGGEMGLLPRLDLDVSSDDPIPDPSYDQMEKFVVVPEETPYRHWSALGIGNKFDVTRVRLVGDSHNMIYALYLPNMPGNLGLRSRMRQAAFRADNTCAGRDPHDPDTTVATQAAPPGVPTLKLHNGTVVCPIIGSAVPPLAGLKRVQVGTDFAALDPASGSLLVVGNGISWLVSTGAGTVETSAMPIKNAGLLLAPAGKGRFHALAAGIGLARKGEHTEPLYYLSFEKGAWSAPIEIGRRAEKFEWNIPPLEFEPDTAPLLWGPRHDVFRIVSADKGRALLIWPTEKALVGRWVFLK